MTQELDRLPIIKVWNLILVPLQGEISDALAERIRDHILTTIRDAGAEGLIIDITGVWMMDSHLCSVISNIAASARLMGTKCFICGMSAQIALTLHAMDVELADVKTALTLEEAFGALGIRRQSAAPKKEAEVASKEEGGDARSAREALLSSQGKTPLAGARASRLGSAPVSRGRLPSSRFGGRN